MQSSGIWFGGNGNLTKELQKWSKMLHNFTKHRLCQKGKKNTLISYFDKIIDFLDKRNEIDLISHSRVFDKVPRRKLLRQDKYLNSKTREGDGAGHAERQSTGPDRSQQMPLTLGLQPGLGDKGTW